MDIKNEIQHQISVNSGSERRVINRTMQNHRCSEKDVKACIDWLLKKEFIKILEYKDMDEIEKRYFESDKCRILKNIKCFDEIKFYDEEKKRKEIEESLSNKAKFELYFTRMEKEFERKNIFNKKNYNLNYGENNVTISTKDNGATETLVIDFGITTDWFYNEATNSIFYKSTGKYYTIELFYLWGDCNLKYYNSY